MFIPEKLQDEMSEWRRDIHAHPELAFQEKRTSELVAARLESFGIEVHRGIGKTGVVGVLKSGTSGRSVGLRADMDALPIQEANTFGHRSRHDGVMHACGHDGHTAMLLGAAQHLARTRHFDGTVHLIFQPAEEGIGGAKAMVDDGLFRRFPCESLFGMHNRPGMALGRFAVRSGPMMAGGAFFDIDVAGRGAHGARPESGIDPVLAAAHIATAIQSIVSSAADARTQGQTMGAVSSLNSLMAVLGPLIGPPLLALVSHLPRGDWRIGAPFYVCASLQLAALVLAVLHFRGQRRARLAAQAATGSTA